MGDWSASGMEFGRGAEFTAERRAIAERTQTRTLDQWIAALEPTKIPFAPLLTYAEAMAGAHGKANAVLAATSLNGKKIGLAAIPVRLRRELDAGDPVEPETRTYSPPPTIGEHNAGVLAEIGLADLLSNTDHPETGES